MLAVGMITCHRPNVDVHDAIVQLRAGGFRENLHVFSEPETPEIRPLANVVVHHNSTRRGVLGNWSHCLKWLLEHTTAEYLMVCEDDVAYAAGARNAWAQALGDFDRVGYWSLYTPRRDRNLVGHAQGWVASNRGRDSWGTQAMCFPRNSARILLDYAPLHNEDQFTGSTDAIVAQCFVDAGLPCYYHNPSLADHLGRVSSVGHNWYDEHVGLDYDPAFEPDAWVEKVESSELRVDGLNPEKSPETPSDDARGFNPSCDAHENPLTPALSPQSRGEGVRAAVVTVFQDNIPLDVVSKQAEVICKFLPAGCEFEPRRVGHHALGLDDYFRDLRHEAYLILDVDCIPLAEWVMPWFLENARAGTVIGAAQRANHLNNDGHIYAGPCALAFSRETYERLGRPSFRDTPRGDVAEELTYRCEEAGIPVTLLWPTQVVTPKWTLMEGADDERRRSSHTTGDDERGRSSHTTGDDERERSCNTTSDDERGRSSHTTSDDERGRSSHTTGDDERGRSSHRIQFGPGTTFAGAVFHAFEISKGQTVAMFLEKCQEVLSGSCRTASFGTLAPALRGEGRGEGILPSLAAVQLANDHVHPSFHEQWYAESELELLEGAARFIRPLKGEIIEIGCWEGRSTSVIANACFPETVTAVDTWRGSVSERVDHETVRIAKERDVFAVFQENMRLATRGNVSPKRMDALEFLIQGGGPIKFCHIDAAHDYQSVRDALALILPRLVRGGMLVGHDYDSANLDREDLQGGVQRAVRELLPQHAVRGNNWWYAHMTQ